MNTLLNEETAVIIYRRTNASYQSMFRASIFSNYLDTVKSMGVVSKEHTCLYQRTLLLCPLLEMSGSISQCREGFLVFVGQKTQLPFKAERR